MEEDQEKTSPIFTDEAKRNIAAYIDTLKRIHIRLMIEGRPIHGEGVIHSGQDDDPESQS